MKIGVFSRLRSRFACLLTGGRTGQKEPLPVEDGLAPATAPFEREIDGLETTNLEGNKNAKALHHQLAWMRALCELDRKFLAGFDLQLVTHALLETVARLFPGSATAVWLVDGTTRRLEAVACRNLEEPEWQPTAAERSRDWAMDVGERRKHSNSPKADDYRRRQEKGFRRRPGVGSF